MSALGWKWTVSFETATIERGFAATKEQAERDCEIAYTKHIPANGNEDKLAYSVDPAPEIVFGRHAPNGEVTITFNSQMQGLPAPPAKDGSPRKYLPCERCGAVEPVEMNAVSCFCGPCYQRELADGPTYREGTPGYDHAAGYHD